MKSTLASAGKGYKSISPGPICPSCRSNNTYYSCYNSSWFCMNCDEVFIPVGPSQEDKFKQYDTVPMPLGKITPSLTGSYSYNTDNTPDWLMHFCPNCQSDNVCVISPTFNLEIEEPRRRWFCISCQDSWEYVVEE